MSGPLNGSGLDYAYLRVSSLLKISHRLDADLRTLPRAREPC